MASQSPLARAGDRASTVGSEPTPVFPEVAEGRALPVARTSLPGFEQRSRLLEAAAAAAAAAGGAAPRRQPQSKPGAWLISNAADAGASPDPVAVCFCAQGARSPGQRRKQTGTRPPPRAGSRLAYQVVPRAPPLRFSAGLLPKLAFGLGRGRRRWLSVRPVASSAPRVPVELVALMMPATCCHPRCVFRNRTSWRSVPRSLSRRGP